MAFECGSLVTDGERVSNPTDRGFRWSAAPRGMLKPSGWRADGGVWFCDVTTDYDAMVAHGTLQDDNLMYITRLYFGPKGGLIPDDVKSDRHVCPDCGVKVIHFTAVDDFLDEHMYHSRGNCPRIRQFLGPRLMSEYLEIVQFLKGAGPYPTRRKWDMARDSAALKAYVVYASPKDNGVQTG
ncbi:ORF79 [Ictalurid herpesvirus 1]|nr:ORF79 [Ictalurid herpesvirus 1]